MPVATPPEPDEITCSACGYGNDPRLRKTGGEYISQTTQITTANGFAASQVYTHPGTGDTVESQDDDSGGCAFCNCPEWTGGGRITWGRFRPGRRDR